MARHSLEPSLRASKWMCFPTCLSSISACLRENTKTTKKFGKHALSINALLPCMLFRPLRLIANVSVFVPAHLRNALLPFLLCNAYCSMSGRWADSNNSWWMSLSFDFKSMWLAVLCCFTVQTYFAECHRASLFSYPCLLMPNCSMSAKYARLKNTDSFQMGQRLCLSPFYCILYWPGNLFSHSEIKCANYLQPLSLHVHVFLHSTHLRVYVDIYIYIHIHTYMYTHTSMSNILKAFNLSTILNMF